MPPVLPLFFLFLDPYCFCSFFDSFKTGMSLIRNLMVLTNYSKNNGTCVVIMCANSARKKMPNRLVGPSNIKTGEIHFRRAFEITGVESGSAACAQKKRTSFRMPFLLAEKEGFSAKAPGSLSSRLRCSGPSLPGAGQRRTAALAPSALRIPSFLTAKQDARALHGRPALE